MTEVSIADWFLNNKVLMEPEVLNFMEATNKLEAKFNFKSLNITVVEN